MRVYVDNCCFNRPFDDQSQVRIRLEAEAKLAVQQHILEKRLTLVWSYILDYENSANPIPERRETIGRWRRYAASDIEESSEVLETAHRLVGAGITSKDALHLACAVLAKCAYFLTTDDVLLKRATGIPEIRVINPAQFITEVLEC
jgi:predicted nucleic acid-binding protein